MTVERWRDKFTIQPGEWVEVARENLVYSISVGEVWDRLVNRRTSERFRLTSGPGEIVYANGQVVRRFVHPSFASERPYTKDEFFQRYWDCGFALLPEDSGSRGGAEARS